MYYGKKVKLRAPKIEEAELIAKYYNNLEVRKFLGNMIPVSVKQEKEWIELNLEGMKKGDRYFFVLENETGEFLGSLGLSSILRTERSARLGIAITNTEYWGKGYGTDAMITLCAFAFQILNLHRIELEVTDFNTRAIRSYEKTGFQQVGKRRQAMFIDGEYHDSIIMDILVDEFKEKHGKIDLTAFDR